MEIPLDNNVGKKLRKRTGACQDQRLSGLSAQQCPTINDDDRCHIFVQTERFHDLLPKRSAFNDVRLSTAALNSARFPLISPAGTIRDKAGIVDRIVDDGYFENYGALSAKELALTVHAYDLTLQLPFSEMSALG